MGCHSPLGQWKRYHFLSVAMAGSRRNLYDHHNYTLPALTRTGLTNGSTYEAQVRATNGVGQQSNYSPSGTATPAAEVPDQVQFVGLTNTTSAIEADWGEPEDNGASITSYRIQWDDNSTFSSPQSANPTNSERTITGLADGTTYYFRVRAVNSAGNGTYSPTSSLSRDDLSNAPSAPPNDDPSGEHVVPSSIFWEWEVPRDNGALITSFELQWRISGIPVGLETSLLGLDASCYTAHRTDPWNYLSDPCEGEEQ